jgi:hypothetical protein
MSSLAQAEVEYRTLSESYRLAGGAGGKQREILLLESRASTICEFQPSVIPGLLQTRAYASELLQLPFGPILFGATTTDIREMVAARLERQRAVHDSSKQIRIVILEAALTTRVCSFDTLLDQVERLGDLCDGVQPLTLGIVPIVHELPLIPLSGYTIYDSDVVILETLSAEQQLSSEEEVSQYIGSFEALCRVAVWGAEASKLIRRVAATLVQTE